MIELNTPHLTKWWREEKSKSFQIRNVIEGFFQHTDFAPYSGFGLGWACVGRIQRKICMRGPRPESSGGRETMKATGIRRLRLKWISFPGQQWFQIQKSSFRSHRLEFEIVCSNFVLVNRPFRFQILADGQISGPPRPPRLCGEIAFTL